MGILNFTVGSYGREANKNVLDTAFRTSGAFITSTSAADVTGAVLRTGEVFVCNADEAMWVAFGGATAAVGTGHYLAAGQTYYFECGPGTNGQVSAIDVA